MRTQTRYLIQATMMALGITLLCSVSRTFAQAKAEGGVEDNLSPAEVTTIMKDAWAYLKTETDAYTVSIGKKTEFETTVEFDKRMVEALQQYIAKIAKYIKDKKLDQRTFGVMLKASLVSYDADNQVYKVASPSTIEAPYNIPSIVCDLSTNPYVAIADSIRKGYRTSSVYLKFDPHFRWQVARDIAQKAKADEANMYFKIRLKIEMAQNNFQKVAKFQIVPKHVQFLNAVTKTVYWEQPIR
ncbi:MAG: hypothetical protein HY088_02575 [Ignavibacteriales bacterium]|nr:hypothetical protein [Ignavibacteriales bacterium]